MGGSLKLGKESQLFIDDYCIRELGGNARRRFHRAKKHPANPIMFPEKPWESSHIQLYGNVLYDPEMKLYRMWYSARFAAKGSRINTVCHAESADGVSWKRTPLDMLEHEGMVLSNAVLKGESIGPTVFHAPGDPDPARRYRMFVYTGDEILGGAPGGKAPFSQHYSVLFSPDGFKWTPYEKNPVVQGGDIATCMYDSVTNEYVAFPKIHRSDEGFTRRCVGASVSKDFMVWKTPNIILSADAVDDARVESRLERFRDILVYDDPEYYSSDMYGMTGFRHEGMRLGLIWLYDRSSRRPAELGGNDDGIINIQLAYSRHWDPYLGWKRAGDRYDLIPCGAPGECDSAMIFTAHTVVEKGDELLIYYSGISTSHGNHGKNEPNKPFTKFSSIPHSLNLAVLRRDGFASIDALSPGGSMTTKPLVFDGDHLIINAEAENGFILVELADSGGKPIPGYTKEEAVPFSGDEIRAEVRWKSGKSVGELKGRLVHAIFHIRTGRLYSFKFC